MNLLEQGSDGGTKINKRTNCYVCVRSLMMGMGNTTCRAKASSCFVCHSQGLFNANCNEWDFWIHRVSPTQAGVKCNWGSPFKDCKDDKEGTGRKAISDTSQAEWVLEHTVPGTTVDFGGYRAEKIFVIVDETFDRTGFPNISREICNQLFEEDYTTTR